MSSQLRVPTDSHGLIWIHCIYLERTFGFSCREHGHSVLFRPISACFMILAVSFWTCLQALRKVTLSPWLPERTTFSTFPTNDSMTKRTQTHILEPGISWRSVQSLPGMFLLGSDIVLSLSLFSLCLSEQLWPVLEVKVQLHPGSPWDMDPKASAAACTHLIGWLTLLV